MSTCLIVVVYLRSLFTQVLTRWSAVNCEWQFTRGRIGGMEHGMVNGILRGGGEVVGNVVGGQSVGCGDWQSGGWCLA